MRMTHQLTDHGSVRAPAHARKAVRLGGRALLLSTASSAIGGFLAVATLGTPSVALAQEECGVAPPGGGSVTCTAAGNPYPNGITYIVPPGDLTINLESDVAIDTSGTLNIGILGLSIGGDSLTINGLTGASINTNDDGAFGILAATDAGDIDVNFSTITTSGTNAIGVVASSATGEVNVNVGTIDTQGDGATGISATTNSGNVTVNGFTVQTSGANAAAVEARSDSGGNVVVTGSTFITNGAGSAGVLAVTSSGDIDISPSAVITNGANSAGILATSFSGDISVNVFQSQTLGANSDSINVTSNSGSVTVLATAVTADGAGSRGIVATGGAGVTINSSGFFVGTGGDGGTAILARSGTGPANINVGNAFTNGANARVIDVASTSGAITVNGGALTSQGADSTALYARGAAAITLTGSSVQTNGANSAGIDALSTGGPVTITGSQITTAGATSNGITASGVGPMIINAGRVGVTGAGSNGIVATTTGSNTVNLTGTGVTSTQGSALNLTGDTVVVTTVAGSAINGRTGGLVAASTSGTTATLRGATGSSTGYAVDISGGSANITNASTGVVTGRIRLSDNADSFTNAGTFNATGVSLFGAGNDTFTNTGVYNAGAGADFGTGTDTFNNSGTFNVLSGAVPVGNVTFANLEAFNNTGLVSLANGRAGDSFTMPGVFNGGVGSRLALDVDFAGAGTADRLLIGSATGTTAVTIVPVNAGLLNTGLVIVDGTSPSAASAFTLDPANVNAGLVQYSILYDAPNANFLLVGTPQSVVFQQALAGEAANNLWRKGSDSWSNHMTSLRDANWAGDTVAMEEGLHVWGEMFGGVDSRDSNRSFTTFGVVQTVDASYEDTYYGFQGGFDWIRPMGNGMLVLGATSGYGGGYLDFDDGSGSIDFTGFNIGGSAGYTAGPVFINGLVKVDFLKGDSTMVPVAGRAEFDATVYGATLEGGYRFGGSGFFVEPVASLSWSRADIDDFDMMLSTFRYDEADSLRGKLGVRVGGKWGMGEGHIVPYGALYAVEEFEGEGGLLFTNGGSTVRIDNISPGTFGQAQLGVNFAPWSGPLSGFTGYVQADGAFGGDMSGAGVSLGFRFKW